MTGISDVSFPVHDVLEFRFVVRRARAATYSIMKTPYSRPPVLAHCMEQGTTIAFKLTGHGFVN
jgi:hypothetical protein